MHDENRFTYKMKYDHSESLIKCSVKTLCVNDYPLLLFKNGYYKWKVNDYITEKKMWYKLTHSGEFSAFRVIIHK